MYLAEGKAPIYLHMLDKVYVMNLFHYCHTVQERGVEKQVSLSADFLRGEITGEDRII